MDTIKIIETLVSRRKELGVTQTELARRAGVSRRTIHAIESGEADVGLRRLVRLLRSLDLSIEISPGTGRPTESQLAHIFRDDDE